MTLMCDVYLVVKPYFRAVSIPYVQYNIFSALTKPEQTAPTRWKD